MGRTGGDVMDVRVLGQIDARSDTRPYALGGPTQRRVFAALVARRGEVVDVSALVDVCWPDGDVPDRAEHNVRTYVHRLRSAMNDDGTRIETVGTGYRFRVERAEVDLDRLDDLARTAARALSTGDVVAALDAVDEADGLWKGRPYGEFADEPWAVAEAAHFAEVRVALDEQRAEALLAAGRPGEAVAGLERLIAEHPLRERPRALLMQALYESGRQAEALRAFQAFRRYLIDESGVEPSRDLTELDRRIADGTFGGTSSRRVGNYELHERIGEGAFAVVHRATQPSLGREVAIKVIRAELANRPEFVRRFEAEAQMIASIEHPSVVPLYDYWREPGQAFLVMRWMTGGSLESRLDDGPWTLDLTIDLVDQIAAALDAAHARQVVHRDVKPANILFDDAGRAFLGDFGIALAADERSTPQAALSEGSPLFASPEQLRREPAGPEADVHALGIVAFTALTGRTPFHDAMDDAELLRRQLTEPVPPISALRPDLPPGLDGVIAVATAKRPVDRFPTAGAFAAAFRVAAGGPPNLDVTSAADRTNPYLGLRPFTEAETDRFHGRSRLVDELIGAIADPDRRLLAVVGPSGSGKSSVVRAGLLPALRAGRVEGSAGWFVTTLVPGAHPFEALETALLRIATNPPAALLEQLRDGPRGITRAASRVAPAGGTVLVVIDQFEELFTLAPEAERRHFLAALATAATEPGGSLRVVLTLRADFYDQPLRHPEFAALFKHSAVAVTPLAPDELEEAITAPATAAGVTFEPGLVAEIVADVNSQPGALPLLQFALTRTFDAADGSTLTTAGYRAVGGLAGALGQRAESLHDEATPDEQQALRRVLERLVTLGDGTDDTRRRVRRTELPTDAATARVVERLGEARLVTFDRDPVTREPTIEIAHEALIREWPRLRSWLDDDRDALRAQRHLTAAAAAWEERDRDPNELYRGARVDATEALVADRTIELNEAEAAFVHASIEQRDTEQESERARLRRLRRLVTATAVVAALALVAGGLALVQWGRADDAATSARANEQEARRQTAVAVAQRLSVQALDAMDEDPDLAILLALESLAVAERAGVEPVAGAVAALHEVTRSSRLIGRFPTTGAAGIDPSGTRVFLAPEPGEVAVVDLATGAELGRTSVGADVLDAEFAGEDRIVVSTADRLLVLDATDLSVLDERAMWGVDSIVPSADGGLVATWTPEGDVLGTTQVWMTDGLASVRDLPATIVAGWWERQLVVHDLAALHVVDVESGDTARIVPPGQVNLVSVDVDARAGVLVTLTPEAVILWTFDGARTTDPREVAIDPGVVVQSAGLVNGGLVASGASDAVLFLPDGTVEPVALRGHTAVDRMSADATGTRLLVGGVGEALLWDLTPDGPDELGAIAVEGEVWDIEFPTGTDLLVLNESADDGRARVRAVSMATRAVEATVDGFVWSFGTGPVVSHDGLVAGWTGGEDPAVVRDLWSGATVAELDPCDVPTSIDAASRWLVVGRDELVPTRCASLANRVVDPRTGATITELADFGGFADIGPPGTIADGLLVYGYFVPDVGPGLVFRELPTGEEIARWEGAEVWRPLFSADGHHVALTGPGGGYAIDVAEVLAGVPVEDAVVVDTTDLGFTTFSVVVGDHFVSGHAGQVLRFWNLADGNEDMVLPVASGDSTFQAPTPDGRFLYYENEGRVLARLPLALDDAIALARERVQRDFRASECERFQLSCA